MIRPKIPVNSLPRCRTLRLPSAVGAAVDISALGAAERGAGEVVGPSVGTTVAGDTMKQ